MYSQRVQVVLVWLNSVHLRDARGFGFSGIGGLSRWPVKAQSAVAVSKAGGGWHREGGAGIPRPFRLLRRVKRALPEATWAFVQGARAG